MGKLIIGAVAFLLVALIGLGSYYLTLSRPLAQSTVPAHAPKKKEKKEPVPEPPIIVTMAPLPPAAAPESAQPAKIITPAMADLIGRLSQQLATAFGARSLDRYPGNYGRSIQSGRERIESLKSSAQAGLNSDHPERVVTAAYASQGQAEQRMGHDELMEIGLMNRTMREVSAVAMATIEHDGGTSDADRARLRPFVQELVRRLAVREYQRSDDAFTVAIDHLGDGIESGSPIPSLNAEFFMAFMDYLDAVVALAADKTYQSLAAHERLSDAVNDRWAACAAPFQAYLTALIDRALHKAWVESP
jgi:hypothetical protein